MRHDLLFAFRSLFKRPGLTLVVVVSLALGIGATTAIFSVLHGVLIRPLPYPEPHELMTVWEDHEARGGPIDEWTGAATFYDWRQENRVFEHLAAWTGWRPSLALGDEPEVLAGLQVTTEYFAVLGIDPSLGRAFLAAEGQPGAEPVVILSHGLWQRRFGGEASVLDSTVELNEVAHRVVGVLPADYRSVFAAAEIWKPFQIGPNMDDRGAYYLRTVGRLRDGVDAEAARTDMARLAVTVAERAPEAYADIGVTLEPSHDRLVGPVRPALVALFGAVILVLLVTCTNVANLLLARAAARRQEMAVRSSLGAGRRRLVRQLLIESQLLALAGGGLGIALGVWGTGALVALAPAGTPRLDDILGDVAVRPETLFFALALTFATGLVFGLLPAWSSTRVNLADALRPGARSAGSPGQSRLRGGLVVAEVALALFLLVGAGLLIESFRTILQVETGFRAEGITTASINLPRARYAEAEQRVALYQRLLESVSSRPEIESAAAVSILPMADNGGSDTSYYIEGDKPPPSGHEPAVWYRMVTPDYFATLSIELMQGRSFSADDREGAVGVVAVGETFARRHFGADSPLGRRMKLGSHDAETPWLSIIAVVRDVRDRSPMQAARDDIYLPHAQWASNSMALVVKGRTADAALPAIRAELQRLDPALPLSNIAPMEELVSAQRWLPRFTASLLGVFAAAALLLAGLGIYGLLAWSVERRRREMGIRLSLGANRSDILSLVVARGLRLAGAGFVLGLLGIAGASRFLEHLLFQVQPTDPGVLAATTAVLLTAVLLACWLPARRAAWVDPVVSLREE